MVEFRNGKDREGFLPLVIVMAIDRKLSVNGSFKSNKTTPNKELMFQFSLSKTSNKNTPLLVALRMLRFTPYGSSLQQLWFGHFWTSFFNSPKKTVKSGHINWKWRAKHGSSLAINFVHWAFLTQKIYILCIFMDRYIHINIHRQCS